MEGPAADEEWHASESQLYKPQPTATDNSWNATAAFGTAAHAFFLMQLASLLCVQSGWRFWRIWNPTPPW